MTRHKNKHMRRQTSDKKKREDQHIHTNSYTNIVQTTRQISRQTSRQTPQTLEI